MSGVWEYAMELESYGLNSVPDKFVCPRHFNAKPIKLFIKKQEKIEKCDYCGRRTSVSELEDVMKHIITVVQFFYTDPANFMYYESAAGGYDDQENIFTSEEIIFYHLGLEIEDSRLQADIEESLNISAGWSDENKYSDNPAEALAYEWDKFKEIVKHKARYLFFEVIKERIKSAGDYIDENPLDILNDVIRSRMVN